MRVRTPRTSDARAARARSCAVGQANSVSRSCAMSSCTQRGSDANRRVVPSSFSGQISRLTCAARWTCCSQGSISASAVVMSSRAALMSRRDPAPPRSGRECMQRARRCGCPGRSGQPRLHLCRHRWPARAPWPRRLRPTGRGGRSGCLPPRIARSAPSPRWAARLVDDNPVNLARRLVALDTANPPGNELACIELIAELLRLGGSSRASSRWTTSALTSSPAFLVAVQLPRSCCTAMPTSCPRRACGGTRRSRASSSTGTSGVAEPWT